MVEPFVGREGSDAASVMYALTREDFSPEAQVIRIQIVRRVQVIEVDDVKCIGEPPDHDPAAVWASGHAQSFPC